MTGKKSAWQRWLENPDKKRYSLLSPKPQVRKRSKRNQEELIRVFGPDYEAAGSPYGPASEFANIERFIEDKAAEFEAKFYPDKQPKCDGEEQAGP